jgi:hypothetical protein
VSSFVSFIRLSFPFSHAADALATANARIASLEAELEASQKPGTLPLLPRSLLRKVLRQR